MIDSIIKYNSRNEYEDIFPVHIENRSGYYIKFFDK